MSTDSFDREFQDELKYLELKGMLEDAENAVAVAVATTFTTGLVPIPFADAPLLVAQQVILMTTICGIFQIDIEKDGLTALAAAALGAGGATIIGKTIATNALKFIPVAGSLIGGAVSGGTAGIVTLAMGNAFIQVCKECKMGKLSESEITSSKGMNMLKDEFKAQLKKNKT